MEVVLHDSHWIPRDNLEIGNRRVLSYPENFAFTLEVLRRHLETVKTQVHRLHPFVEKFDVATLNDVDWPQSPVVFSKGGGLLIAPEPVKRLLNADRRIRYLEARDHIFGGFRILPFEIFRFGWIALVVTAAWLSELWCRRYLLRRRTSG